MKRTKRIAVTGIGPLTAGGSGNDEVWRAIEAKRTGVVRKEYRIGDETAGNFFVHAIPSFSIDGYGFSRQVLDEIKAWKGGEEIEDINYFLATIAMALKDSGAAADDAATRRTGLVAAHENIGQDHFYAKVIDELSFTGDGDARPATKKGFLQAFYAKFRKTGYELQTFMSLFHIVKALGIHGYSVFLNNACASGLYALEAAADVIRSGKCDRMVVAAVDRSSIFKQMWFSDIDMLAKDGRIKPFAADRDGFTIGDGGAALVLEGLDDARARGARVYAEYLGGGFTLEGWKVTYPDISNDYYRKAIIDALAVAGLQAADVDLVVPHGVGTTITDRYEARAMVDIFGKAPARPVISALKPYTGHTLGASALLETAIMLLALDRKKIPATMYCGEVDRKLGIEVLQADRPADGMKVALKIACGFAGFNGACLFRTAQG